MVDSIFKVQKAGSYYPSIDVFSKQGDFMYALRLEPDFINNLTPEGRRWLARAVVNMINIDGKLDPNEMPYMHDAVILIDESERAELLENAQQRNYMELPNLTTDRKLSLIHI